MRRIEHCKLITIKRFDRCADNRQATQTPFEFTVANVPSYFEVYDESTGGCGLFSFNKLAPFVEFRFVFADNLADDSIEADAGLDE